MEAKREMRFEARRLHLIPIFVISTFLAVFPMIAIIELSIHRVDVGGIMFMLIPLSLCLYFSVTSSMMFVRSDSLTLGDDGIVYKTFGSTTVWRYEELSDIQCWHPRGKYPSMIRIIKKRRGTGIVEKLTRETSLKHFDPIVVFPTLMQAWDSKRSLSVG
jgi:hypothetical protein